jgi:hypothetical protein
LTRSHRALPARLAAQANTAAILAITANGSSAICLAVNRSTM